MEKRHLKLISIALATSLFTLSSCVDNDYDLNDDIDLTISVGGEEFAIPGGKTEAIKLSKILKVEEGDLVKIDKATGDYFLLQTGSPSNTDIRVDGFDIASPSIPPIRPELSFDYPTQSAPRVADIKLEAKIPENQYKTTFNLTASLPKEIKSLTHIDLNIDAKLTFSFNTGITKKLNLEDITIKFPDYILSDKLVNGVLHIKNQPVLNGGFIIIDIPIKGIKISPQNITNGKLTIDGEILLNGMVSVMSSDLIISQSPVSVILNADVALDNIQVTGVTGKVKPDINITVEPITLNDLPDFLSDEEVRLDVTNPQIFFTANNHTPVEASVKGTLTSILQPESSNMPTASFAIPQILSNLNQAFCLSPINPQIIDTTWIDVPQLPSLVAKIPKEIQIQIEAEAADKESQITLNRNYSIQTDYSVKVPFMYGDKLTIVYKDTIDGWQEDIEDYDVKAVNATAYVINKIPLNLILTAVAITKDAKDEHQELKGVAVVVKVNGIENGIIKAGDINQGTTTPIVIEIKETIAGSVKKLDGLQLKAVADSKGTTNGYLNENQTIQLTDVKLKVPGGLIIDLN